MRPFVHSSPPCPHPPFCETIVPPSQTLSVLSVAAIIGGREAVFGSPFPDAFLAHSHQGSCGCAQRPVSQEVVLSLQAKDIKVEVQLPALSPQSLGPFPGKKPQVLLEAPTPI